MAIMGPKLKSGRYF